MQADFDVGTTTPSSTRRRVLGGLLVRREAWTLSRSSRVLLLFAVVAGLCGFGVGAYWFLAVNDGGSGDVLVVEGWIGGRRIDDASAAFKRGQYRCVVVVRDLYQGDDKWSTGRYTADYVAADLVQQGVPKDVVQLLFCPVVRKDRTYHCALAVREWLAENHMQIKALDVATLATHSRRSRLLYEKAFGRGVRIGAIALEDPSYDPKRWWHSSAGVRDVVGEMLAYVYSRLFFWPDAADRDGSRGVRSTNSNSGTTGTLGSTARYSFPLALSACRSPLFSSYPS